MRFGPIPVSEVAGSIAAHGLRIGDVVVKKGARISPALAADLAASGVESLVAVRLDDGDVGEDEAALALATRSAGEHVRVESPFTGRSNLFAGAAGVLIVDRSLVDALNSVHESVTLATLPAFKPVLAGEMVATVKIIPYAIPRGVLDAASEAALQPAVSVARWRLSRVGVVSTLTTALKPSTVRKTIAALQVRLALAGAGLSSEASCPHEPDALAAELRREAAGDSELVVVFGASAIADRRDVIPAAIEAAGGRVEHLGMPVDPGNLLLLGRLAGKPIIGAPGCARSPRENGFDWVLQRLLAGLPITRADIAGMGVGGLLMEIVSRGQPREGGEPEEE